MAKATGRTTIYTIGSTKFTTPIGDLPVTSFKMTLTLGALPSATVGVDLYLDPNSKPKPSLAGPSSYGGPAPIPDSNKYEAFSVGSVSKKYNKLLELASKLSKCSFSATVLANTKEGGTGTTQNISLDGWLLVAVGLGSLSTTNAFGVQCTILHPAYALALRGGFCFNWGIFPEPKKNQVASVKDPLDAGIKMYMLLQEKLKKTLKYACTGKSIKPNSAGQDEVNNQINGTFSDVPRLLGNLFVWDPAKGGGSSGIPLGSYAKGNIPFGIKKAMMDLWAPTGEASVWDILIRQVCSSLDLTIIPDYTAKKLPIVPFYPWLTPTLTINDDNLFEINSPGVDPSPVYGISGAPRVEFEASPGLSVYKAAKAQKIIRRATALAFVPKGGAEINGKFFPGTVPQWVVSAIAQSTAASTSAHEPTPSAFSEPSEPATSEAGSGDNIDLQSAGDIRGQCMACEFLKLYKKRLEASVTGPLMFDAPSGKTTAPILPGSVVTITSNSIKNDKGEAGTLFAGYIVGVTHTMSMHDSFCATGIQIAYCRPEKGYEFLESVMNNNPMYS